MVLRCIDVESTGLDPKLDRVIEIASIDLTRDGITNPMQTFCSLPSGMPIPPEASSVHHILLRDLVGAPTYEQARERFLGADYYIAHNAQFDQSFLNLPAPLICTHKCAWRIWTGLNGNRPPSYSNQVLRYWLGEEEPFGVAREQIAPHRAASDVLVTAAIFHRMLKVEGVAFSDLVRWSTEPYKYTWFTFGKHKGESIRNVPVDYLQWLAGGKHEMGSDWIAVAYEELTRRKGR